MDPIILLLITIIIEMVVVFLHGTGVRVAFGVGFILQVAYAVWGFMIGDMLFGASGVTLAILNLYFHFHKADKQHFRRGVEIEDLWISNFK